MCLKTSSVGGGESADKCSCLDVLYSHLVTQAFGKLCHYSISLFSQLLGGSSPVTASQVALMLENPPANAGDTRDTGSIPALGRSCGKKEIATHPRILAWRIHGQRNLAGCSPWGRKELDMTEVTWHTQPSHRRSSASFWEDPTPCHKLQRIRDTIDREQLDMLWHSPELDDGDFCSKWKVQSMQMVCVSFIVVTDTP